MGMKAETLSDAKWAALDELRCNLGCGAGDPRGGWFQITPDQISGLEALIERLDYQDDHTDAIFTLQSQVAAFQQACGELLRQIAEGDCQVFEGDEPGQPSPCSMIEHAMQSSGVNYMGNPS
jgi:hypothetical protein